MKITFRVDASLLIGSGHVMRCLVLAERFNYRDWKFQFACIPQVGDLIAYIEQKGFTVTKLVRSAIDSMEIMNLGCIEVKVRMLASLLILWESLIGSLWIIMLLGLNGKIKFVKR